MSFYGFLKKRVFISFDADNDIFLRDALVGQARHPDSPFEIEDWSVKIPWNVSEWKEKCAAKIKRCDLLIVMVGPYTKNCSGVIAEIQMAKNSSVPVVGVKGYKDKICPAPVGLEGYYNWTWDNIKNLVSGQR